MKQSTYVYISAAIIVLAAGGFVLFKFAGVNSQADQVKTAQEESSQDPVALENGSVQGATVVDNLSQGADITNNQSIPMITSQDPAPAQSPEQTQPKKFVTSEGLTIEIFQDGEGDAVTRAGDTISVHYIGTLDDGSKFDSSIDRQQAFSFQVGAGQVIKGWDRGLLSMKVGEIRRLTIPPALGYGAAGTPGGPIPPNATLHFDVQL